MALLDDVLANFGNADYSKEFWESCVKQRRAEQKQYAEDERNSQLAVLQNKDKVFGPLIGD